mmetsp:Transcript_11887/g.38091  ORF Transcript_11887/g.38091 Transcript_11887/m.38091 type:complete len:276 (-) Transcript_11887:269-1096(-)
MHVSGQAGEVVQGPQARRCVRGTLGDQRQAREFGSHRGRAVKPLSQVGGGLQLVAEHTIEHDKREIFASCGIDSAGKLPYHPLGAVPRAGPGKNQQLVQEQAFMRLRELERRACVVVVVVFAERDSSIGKLRQPPRSFHSFDCALQLRHAIAQATHPLLVRVQQRGLGFELRALQLQSRAGAATQLLNLPAALPHLGRVEVTHRRGGGAPQGLGLALHPLKRYSHARDVAGSAWYLVPLLPGRDQASPCPALASGSERVAKLVALAGACRGHLAG